MFSRTQIIFILVIIAINNIAWLLYSSREVKTEVVASSQLSRIPSNETPVSNFEPHASSALNSASSDVQDKAKKSAGAESEMGEPAQGVDNTPAELEELSSPITAEAQNMFYERELDAEYFFYNDKEQKLETLATLSPQGDDLTLLQEVIAREEDNQIKVAAIRKLNQENNYAATKTLLSALDDEAPEVALAAMETIVKNGDRTLLPILKEKFPELANGDPVKQQMTELIRQLEYSVSMQMDDVH